MIALRKPSTTFTFEDYLAWEQGQAVRHEYVGGVAYAMAGGIQAHHDVATNAVLGLSRIFGEHCRVYSQGFKVRVRRADDDDRAYYPDVFVTCQPGESQSLYNETPCLVVEVLSESTRRIDLTEKRDAYCGLPTMEAYLVIDPSQAMVRAFRRASGWAEQQYEGLEQAIDVGCGPARPQGVLLARELYRNVFP